MYVLPSVKYISLNQQHVVALLHNNGPRECGVSRNVLKSVPYAVPSRELFFSQMKLFFYNRTSLSNVIIRKYFVCDISLDSIPRSCHLIQMTDPLLTTISGTGATPLPGYHRHILLCHTHIQGCKPFSGPIVGTKNLILHCPRFL